MPLTIQHEEADMAMHTVTRRLYQTEDGRAVPEGDPDARWLLCVPGQQIPVAQAEASGIVAAGESAEPSLADGNVAEVLDRVGDDPDLAAAALEAEQAKSKPRVTLVDALTEITENEGDEGGEG